MADVGFYATRSNLVIVRQIDVEHELFGNGPKGGGFAKGFTVTRVGAIDGADFEAGGVKGEDLLAKAAINFRSGTKIFQGGVPYRSEVAKLWYRRYESFWRVKANSRFAKSLQGFMEWLSHWNRYRKGNRR